MSYETDLSDRLFFGADSGSGNPVVRNGDLESDRAVDRCDRIGEVKDEKRRHAGAVGAKEVRSDA